MKQVWCSSAINPPIKNLQISTDPQDGKNYLTAREDKSGFHDPIHLKWDDWGFTYIN